MSLVRSIVVTSISTECLSRARGRFKWPCDTESGDGKLGMGSGCGNVLDSRGASMHMGSAC